MGFEEWFPLVKKNCEFFRITNPPFKTICEFVDNLCWTGELEVNGSDISEPTKKLNIFLSALKIPKEKTTFKSLGRIYADTLKL